MSHKIITIGREYGSGGRKIAQKVAEKLSLVYYDNEIIDMAAQELGYDVEMIRRASEQKSSSFLYTMTTGAAPGSLLRRPATRRLPMAYSK